MSKQPSHIENSSIGTDPSQMYVWDDANNKPIRVKGNADGSIAGGATEGKQDAQIVLATALNALALSIKQNQLNRDDIYKVLQDIKAQLQMPVYYVDASNSINTSGTTTATISSGTVTTLTNQTNIGGFSADMITENASVTEWATSIRPLLI